MKYYKIIFTIVFFILTNIITAYIVSYNFKVRFKNELIRIGEKKEHSILEHINNIDIISNGENDIISIIGISASRDIDIININPEVIYRTNLAILLEGELPNKYEIIKYNSLKKKEEILVSVVRKDINDNTVGFNGMNYIFKKKNGKFIIINILGEQ